MREQIELLKHESDLAAKCIQADFLLVDVLVVEGDNAAVDFLKTVDRANQRGFARTGRPAYHDNLALAYLGIDIYKRMIFAIPFIHAGKFDHVGSFEWLGAQCSLTAASRRDCSAPGRALLAFPARLRVTRLSR